MGYQVIEPNRDPLYLDFLNHKIDSNHKPFEQYTELYKCSGLWNNSCVKCTLEELNRMISWMCAGDYYEDSTGTKLFVHGYSLADMT